MRVAGVSAFLAAGFAALPGAAQAPVASVRVSSSPAASSTAAPGQKPSAGTTMGPADLYSGDKWHDPFLKPSAAAAAAVPVHTDGPKEFSIHDLSLKGVLRAATGDIALLTSSQGDRYYLKNGRLYDPKGKTVKGVSGKVFAGQKKVLLETPDQDVQTLFLGVEESEQ